MSTKTSLASCFLAIAAAFGWVAACSDSSTTAAPGASSSSSGGHGSSSGGQSSGGGSGSGGQSSGGGHDSGPTDARAESGSPLGLLVDNMTAKMGTQISLQVPTGLTPGSYYVYADSSIGTSNYMLMKTIVTGGGQLADVPVTPPVTNTDGSQIVGEICFGGQVVSYAGLGMSFAYGTPDVLGANSPPEPFNASHYSGISFYIKLDATDAGSLPSIRVGIPDTQTADPAALPTSACALADAGQCDDDFGENLMGLMPGVWTKFSFTWDELTQGGWGASFAAIKSDQLIGMKWQANGAGFDAALDTFNFCISDIYFTP